MAYQGAAEVHRWRAEWKLTQQRSVSDEVREGRKHIRDALSRNPGLADALVTDAALLVIQAEAEPRGRTESLQQARVRLTEAQELNPLINRKTEPISRRLDTLSQDSR